MRIKRVIGLLVLATTILVATSCGEVARIRRSDNVALAYDYAKKYYNLEKYKQSAELLPEVVSKYSGNIEGGRALYMLAYSEMKLKHYTSAVEYFHHYIQNYPKGEQIEDARYCKGVCLYESAPDPRLDQTITLNAIHELQVYNELYPTSPRRNEVKEMLFSLQDRLAQKELLSAQLYYDLGMFLGNNYRSAIITANNALKEYPYSHYREDFYILLLRATYQEAIHSVDVKLQTRYRDVADRYFIYINEFPEGKYLKEAKRIYDNIAKQISDEA